MNFYQHYGIGHPVRIRERDLSDVIEHFSALMGNDEDEGISEMVALCRSLEKSLNQDNRNDFYKRYVCCIQQEYTKRITTDSTSVIFFVLATLHV